MMNLNSNMPLLFMKKREHNLLSNLLFILPVNPPVFKFWDVEHNGRRNTMQILEGISLGEVYLSFRRSTEFWRTSMKPGKKYPMIQSGSPYITIDLFKTKDKRKSQFAINRRDKTEGNLRNR